MKAKKSIKINKITSSWEPIGKEPKFLPGKKFSMRPMQKDAYETLLNKKYAILNAPTASGKSLALCWVTSSRLKRDESLRTIIAVPQTMIGDGFKGFYGLNLKDLDGNIVGEGGEADWSPLHYLFDLNTDTNISQLHSFLKNDRSKKDINDRVLICSHSSLVTAYKKYKNLFKNITIVIDEAHRGKYTEQECKESGESLKFCNQLGHIVSHALNKPESGIELILSTATMFRGDKIEIIPARHLSKFTTFHYPMDEYLADCFWLSGFSYDFAMYDKDWGDTLKDIFKQEKKTIVYLPSVNSKYYSYGSKERDLNEVFKSIDGKENYEIRECPNGMTQIKRGNKWLNVVNLVDDSSVRDKRKELVINAHDHDDNSKVDIVIALNMFREGANWKWAERSIIIGTKGSLTDMVQILGRLFRDAKDKKHIEAIQLLPFSFDQSNKEKFRENLNEYSKVIFAMMLIEDAINPVKINIPSQVNNVGVEKKKMFNDNIDHLSAMVSDKNKVLKIWTDIRDAAIIAQDLNKIDLNNNNKESRTKFYEIVSEILMLHGIKSKHVDIAEYIRRRWIRESLKNNSGIALDLTQVDFDTISINPLSFWLTYTSGMCGLDTFRNFRKALANTYYLPYEETIKYGRLFAKSYDIKNMTKTEIQTTYAAWVRGELKDSPHIEGLPTHLKVYEEYAGW